MGPTPGRGRSSLERRCVSGAGADTQPGEDGEDAPVFVGEDGKIELRHELATWVSTVRSVRNSGWAMPALVRPSAIVGPLMPSSDGDIAFGVVEAVIAAVAAWGLWRHRRWGRVMTIVVATLNLVLDAPAIVAGSTIAIKVAGGVTVLVCLAVIVLLIRPEGGRR